MKGLLHSKRFKKNLCKWLFMYVGCMLILTTVVTYSKYMSTIQSSDSARVAKFNVEVYNYDCNETITNNCNLDWYRSTSSIDYYFVVDTTDIEVKTQLLVTLYIKDDFELANKTLTDVTNPEMPKEYTLKDPISVTDNTNFNYLVIDNPELSTIEAAQGSKKIFKISLKYINNKNVDYAHFNGNNKDIVKVAYSAVQLAK